MSSSAWPVPRTITGRPVAFSTARTALRAVAAVMRWPAPSTVVSCSEMMSAPAASAAFAQAATSPMAAPQALVNGSGHSSPGFTARTSTATTGRLGTLPSKPRNGSVVWPPTVTVWLRVPPSAAVAPSVIWRMLPDHFSIGISTFTGMNEPPLRIAYCVLLL